VPGKKRLGSTLPRRANKEGPTHVGPWFMV
jgi:hypothetical protein